MTRIELIVDFFGADKVPQVLAHEQDRCRQRAFVQLLLALIIAVHNNFLSGASAAAVVLPYVMTFYAGLSLVYLRLLQSTNRNWPCIQLGFLASDQVISVACLAIAPEILAPLCPMLMVWIVRCGLRYGVRVMWLSWFSTIAPAAATLPLVGFWHDNALLAQTFAVMLLITPIFFGPLLVRLHNITSELRAAAMSDPLTGLGNRRMLEEHLRYAQARAERDGSSLAVLAFDLDNFKTVNDTLGHNAGDHLLEVIARAVKDSIRAGDFLARTGGDEFILLAEGLSQADGKAQAQALAEKIVATVRDVATQVCPTVPVSASVGVHVWSSGAPQSASAELANLIDVADRAMYSAKRAGKGRAVMATAAA